MSREMIGNIQAATSVTIAVKDMAKQETVSERREERQSDSPKVVWSVVSCEGKTGGQRKGRTALAEV